MHRTTTRFWLIRHATVAPEALAELYGQRDVPVCGNRMLTDVPRYSYLARILPRDAHWLVTPLSRTHRTAEAISRAGYGATNPAIEPGLIEQSFGEWEGRSMSEFAGARAEHPFWPIGGDAEPPGGESFVQLRARVGAALMRRTKTHLSGDIIAISHGGAIRAAIAHALNLSAHQALSLAVENLSLTVLEHHTGWHPTPTATPEAVTEGAWRIVTINEHSAI
jgi:broad specificity phosphatase PhoE